MLGRRHGDKSDLDTRACVYTSPANAINEEKLNVVFAEWSGAWCRDFLNGDIWEQSHLQDRLAVEAQQTCFVNCRGHILLVIRMVNHQIAPSRAERVHRDSVDVCVAVVGFAAEDEQLCHLAQGLYGNKLQFMVRT